jgi:hypothetical protein
MKLVFRSLFVLLLGAILILILSDDAQRMVRGPLDRFREHFFRMRGGIPAALMPMAATKLANDQNISVEKAYAQVTAALATAPRFRFEGQVIERLPSGHVMVLGKVHSALTVVAPRATAYALFGYPSSEKLALNSQVRCDVQTSGVYHFARAEGAGARMEELIYAGAFTSWTNERGRTLLDRP